MARYRIDPERSKVTIDARSSVHPIHSEAGGLEGWLDLDVLGGGRVNLSAEAGGHLEFPVEQLRSRNPLEDRELKRRIDARRFPRITGDLTSVKDATTDGRYLVGGDLTFKGQTNHYEDELEITAVDDQTICLHGTAEFDVRDFGMEPPKVLMLKVQPEVTVEVEITAHQES